MSDLISRKIAIELLENTIAMTKKEERRKNYCVELIKAMPSAYPKKGKWIYTRYYTWECSECKKNPTLGTGYVQRKDELFEFCPNCGADMRGESDD